MRIGNWRGLAAAVALVAASATPSLAAGGLADMFPWIDTIPRVTYARDLNTGQQYYAPPIPYGHYAKDPVGHAYGAASGAVHGVKSHLTGAVHGGFGGGHGHGGPGTDGCDTCDGDVVGTGGLGHGGGSGHGLFGHGGAPAIPAGGPLIAGNGGGHAIFGDGGHGHGPIASAQVAAAPSAQVVATGQGIGGHGLGGCLDGGLNGCGLGHGLFGALCGGANGCGGDGACGGLNGCGTGCGGFNGCHGDGACGGLNGCGAGLKNKLLGPFHKAKGLLAGMHPKNKVKYFVGPGGPVPLTPGYVPYIVPTRSPRDFFAFPPFKDQALE